MALGSLLGGALGTITLGPLGGLAGGFLGGQVEGLFKGRSRGDRLRQLFESQLEMAQQPASQQAFFQAGLGQLQALLQERARRDAGMAAARGLSGSEFEIAQAASRNQALATGVGSLLQAGERFRFGREQTALQGLLAAEEMERQKQGQLLSLISQAVPAAIGAFVPTAPAGV